MSVLVTGGLGYLGSHTVVELLGQGYDCIVVDNLSNSDLENLDRIKRITRRNIKFYKIDLLDLDKIEKVFEENIINSVIHFAGYKNIIDSINNPLMYYEHNIQITINLLKAMDKFDVKKLVFSSSATVYGDLNDSPIKESAPTSATNPYGRTKLIIEKMLNDLVYANHNWSVVSLRYFNPVGAHPSGLLGERLNGKQDNIMPVICEVALGKRKR